MKTKRLFISTLIAAAAMGLTAYANEAATQTTPVIAETDAPEGADKLLPLADAPAAEDAAAPAEETQDADALELLLADDALVELDEAAAPDELSTETMMREWIARYVAAARFAGIRSVKGTGGGLSSGGAVATAGADFTVSAAAPTPSVSVPAAGTVSLADTLTRASAADVSLGSASASDAGTASVATASSASGTGTILPAAFFSTRSVFSAVPAAAASYSLTGSSGVSAYAAGDDTTTEDSETTIQSTWPSNLIDSNTGRPTASLPGFGSATLNASSTTLELSGNTTVTISGNPGSAINIDTAGYLLAVIADGNEVQFNGKFAGGGAVWFKQGRFQARNAGFFDGIGDVHVSEASQLQLSAATMNIANNFFLGSVTGVDGTAALRVGVWTGSSSLAVNATLGGVTTVLAEGTKIGFQYGSILDIQQLTGSGNIDTVNHASGGILKISGVTGDTGYTGKINLVSDVTLNWTNATATFGGLSGTAGSAGTVAGGSYLNIKDAKDGSTFAGTVGAADNGVALTLSGSGTQAFTGMNYFSTVSVADTASLALGGTTTVSEATTISGGSLTTAGSTTFSGSVSVNGGTLSLGGTTSVTGDVSVSNGTLDVSSGTHTFGGAFTAGENAILALGSVSADSAALSATGNVTLSQSTIFDIDPYVANAKLVSSSSGTLSVDAGNLGAVNLSIGGYLVNQRGSSATFTVADNNTLVLSSYTTGGENYSLVWDGGDDGVWKANGSGWVKTDEASSTSANFQNGDAVTFATNAAEVTIGGAILADTITISEDTTFKLASGQNQALSAASITVASGKNLQLEGAVLGTITNGISLVAADSVLTLKDVAPPNGNTIFGSGKVVLNQTSSSMFTISETVFTDGISLEKIGSGTVNLSAAQSHAGGTKITGGALGVNHSSALGSGTLTLNGGTLLANANNLSFSNTVEVTAASGVNTQGNTMTLGGAISGTGTLTKAGTGTLVLATGFGGTGDTRWTSGNFIVSAGTLQWGQGGTGAASAGNVKALGENITVSAGANLKLWLWKTTAANTNTTDKVAVSSKIILDGTDSSTATLSTEDGSYYFSGGIQIGDGTNAGNGTFTAKWAKGHVIGSLSGAGTFTINEAAVSDTGTAIFSIAGEGGFSGTVNFNYLSENANNTSRGAELHLLTENALKNATVNLTSSVDGKTATLSLDAGTVNIKGLKGTSAGRVVAATAGNTLAIATETGVTNTFSGTLGTSTSAVGLSVSGSGTQELLGTSYLGDVSVSGGALTLDGAATLSQSKDSSAFTVSGGTLTFADDLALSLKLTGDGVLGETVKLVDISGSGSVAQTGMSLDIANITYNGKTLSTRITGATFDNSTGLISFEGKALSLTWSGGDAGTWDKSTANFTSEGVATAFVDADDVTFATSGAVVSIAEAVRAEKITISKNTTFNLDTTQTGTKLLSATSIEVASGANLQLEGSVLGSITGGINLVAADSVLTLKDVAPPNGNAISGSGKVVLNQTSSSDFNITAASVFSGNISLEKTGSGTVNLKAAQTYNGDTTVSAGALNVSAALTTAGRLTVEQGASMTLSAAGRFAEMSIGGNLSTTTTLTSTGALSVNGTLTSSAAVSATQLSGSGRIDLGSTGTLTLSNTGAAKFDNWTGTIKVSGRTNVTGDMSSNWNCAGATVEFSNTQGWLIGWDGNTTFASNLKLTKTMNGTTEVSAFRWSDGSASNSPVIEFTGSVTGDGRFEKISANRNQSFVFSRDLSGFTGTFTYTESNGTSYLKFGGKDSAAEGISAADGSVTGTSTINWYQGTLTESQDKRLYFNYSNDVRSDSTIMSAILVKQGAGSLTLTGTNTYTGGTTIENGTLVAANADALGSGTVTAAGSDGVDSVTLKVGASADAVLTLKNDISVSAGKTLILESSNAGNKLTGTILGENGALKLSSGTLEIAGTTTTLQNATVSNDAVLKFNGTTTTVSDTAEGIHVDGGGSLVFSSGTATVGRIILNTGTSGNNAASVEVSGGVLNITGGDAHVLSIGAASGTATHVVTVSGTGTLNVLNNLVTMGYWSTGKLELTGGEANLKGIAFGESSASGTLEVSNARLNLGASGISKNSDANTGRVSFGEGATIGALDSWSSAAGLGISLAGTVTFDTTKMVASTSSRATESTTGTAGTTITLAGALSGSGTLTKVGAGTLKLTGDNSAYTGTVKLSAGTLEIGHSNALGSNALDITGGSELELGSDASGNALTISNNLSVLGLGTVTVSSAYDGNELSGSITASGQEIRKVGNGTLTLSGTNTGGSLFIVNVAEGKIIAKTDTALGAGMGADVADYHKVRLSGGKLEIGSGVTLAQTNIEITLSDLYKTETAISGAGKLADGTTIKISQAETAAMSLSAEAAQDAYKIYAETLVTAGSTVNVVLSDALKAEGWSVMLKDGVYMIAIPEPSLFGLLAGVTALGFSMSSRRRRKKA